MQQCFLQTFCKAPRQQRWLEPVPEFLRSVNAIQLVPPKVHSPAWKPVGQWKWDKNQNNDDGDSVQPRELHGLSKNKVAGMVVW